MKGIKCPYIIYALISLMILVYIYLRINIIETRYYDHDEFQHLNATWNLFNGKIPYRDYFEHHFPWLYFLSSFLFHFYEDIETSVEQTLSLFKLSRYFMQIFFVMSSFLMMKIFLLIKGRLFAALGLLLFFTNNIFLSKTIEFRPDVPGFFFALLSLYYVIKKIKNNNTNDLYLSYFTYGIAIMFTQKYLVLLPSLVITHLLLFNLKSKPLWLFEKLKCLSFLVFPFLVTYSAFYLLNGHEEFFEQNILSNFKWKKVGNHSYHTATFLNGMKYEIILCLLGIVTAVIRYLKERTINKYSVLFGINILWFYISLLIIPISALQFYLILIPSILYFIIVFVEVFKRKEIQASIIIAVVCLNLYNKIHFFNSKKSPYRVTQERIIEYITVNTDRNDIVFGGNPLFATFRKHIGHYQFIHAGVFLMMPLEEIDFIEKNIINKIIIPKIITYDYNVRLFSDELIEFIEKNYKYVEGTQFRLGPEYEIKLLRLKKSLPENNH